MQSSNLKFVVLKGMEGFGDRLQCLLQAIIYAQTTKRILVVDWSDFNWTHEKKINSDFYFRFKNLLFFPYETFYEYFSLNHANLSVYPEIWKRYLLDTDYENFIYKDIFQVPEINKDNVFWKIANWAQSDFKEDIVVMPGVSNRAYNYKSFEEIIFNKWITDKIKDYAKSNKLISKKYDVIHLRAGSKTWAKGHEGYHKGYSNELKNKFPNLEVYMKYLYSDINKKKQSAGSKKENTKTKDFPLYLISDSSWLIDQWIKKYGIGLDIKNNNDKSDFFGKSGTHKFNKIELEEIKSNKVDLNYEAILDFHILLNARFIGHDGISRFPKMAENIGKVENAYFKF